MYQIFKNSENLSFYLESQDLLCEKIGKQKKLRTELRG